MVTEQQMPGYTINSPMSLKPQMSLKKAVFCEISKWPVVERWLLLGVDRTVTTTT